MVWVVVCRCSLFASIGITGELVILERLMEKLLKDGVGVGSILAVLLCRRTAYLADACQIMA